MKNLFNLCFIFLFMLFISVCSPAEITFTNVTQQSGVGDPGTRAATWGDYDNDGDIDLYVGIGLLANTPSRLFLNNGNGTFTDVTHLANVENYERSSEGAGFGDYDNDGDIDLYVVNWGGQENVLYRNNGDGTFTDVSADAGVNASSDGLSGTFADYDNDGDLDLCVANYGVPNLLYRNNGDGTFTDVAEEASVADSGRSFFHQFADYDNDGDMDLYVINGIVSPAPDALYRNNGDGTFTAVAKKPALCIRICQRQESCFLTTTTMDGWICILSSIRMIPTFFISTTKTARSQMSVSKLVSMVVLPAPVLMQEV